MATKKKAADEPQDDEPKHADKVPAGAVNIGPSVRESMDAWRKYQREVSQPSSDKTLHLR